MYLNSGTNPTLEPFQTGSPLRYTLSETCEKKSTGHQKKAKKGELRL